MPNANIWFASRGQGEGTLQMVRVCGDGADRIAIAAEHIEVWHNNYMAVFVRGDCPHVEAQIVALLRHNYPKSVVGDLLKIVGIEVTRPKKTASEGDDWLEQYFEGTRTL